MAFVFGCFYFLLGRIPPFSLSKPYRFLKPIRFPASSLRVGLLQASLRSGFSAARSAALKLLLSVGPSVSLTRTREIQYSSFHCHSYGRRNLMLNAKKLLEKN
ncbi:hypothetical protein DRF68_02320 [Candidatus Chryseobacterium massiliae]|uniref:Uncharacterized protein n=1 Tax=Candidatus Chryseobacterium massiliense TaxID=204089 RepID=A0A3D9BGB3_9FLAO|nr:hypothetical protein DRF68_02320 [Candidatus Chryseobacterium massiliae]